ncbi:heavy metal translocating P-type ATPase [Gemmata obscuriglobus]|nr:cation-translocating P-type ATPase [Gemmata obscuriglobus]
MTTCANCHGPITGAGYAGRADGDRPAPLYCCFGCLAVAERACGAGACGAGAEPEFAQLGWRLGVGVLVVGQSMIFGLALNVHDDVPPAARDLAQWGILAGTALVAALLGGPLVRAAARELRRGRLTIEALFLLTATGALAASLQAHLTGRGKIYFEVVSVLLVVYTLGKVIGARSRAAALAGSRAWGDRLSLCRLLGADGAARTVAVADVRPGDVVEVHPGELVPVDGLVRDGTGFVSESAVSGEPFAVVRRPGDRVLAGSASFDAAFRVTATASGREREIDRLLKVVEEARDKPLSLQSRADRLGRWLFPLVVFTALGTFAYWSLGAGAGWEVGLFNAMSVLLVACPCVIGLATPVVVWSALNRLAERGVIVNSGDALERLAAVDRVMFDKTGTLTDDAFALVDVRTVAVGAERAKLLGWLSLVQAQSSHPVAKPFAELPRPFAPGAEPRVESLHAVPGCGVVAQLVETDGTRHEVKAGVAEWAAAGAGAPEPDGSKTVHISVDGAWAGVAVLTERLRDSTPRALAHFAKLGVPVQVLTGDVPGRAEALGLPDARGGMLPDEKRAAVARARAEGAKPLFVGDGINDASALASAHVGVALASGTDLAVSAAPVTLYGGDLSALPWAVELSRSAVRAVRANLARAVAYNLVGMTLAACGALHPVVAAVLMVVSSLTLIFSSTRVGCGHEEPTPPAPLPEGKGEKDPPPSPLPEGKGEKESLPSDNVSARPLFSSPLPSGRGLGGGSFSPFPSGRGAGGVGLAHALAFALQGAAFLLLLAALRTPVAGALTLVGFATVGAGLALAWHRCTVPHWLDMCFGMVTFGNLGMVLGWWADNGCAALPDHACCGCVEAMREGVMRPWMWVGMLTLANVAMKWFGKGPAPGGEHAVAMYTGGNVGMALGMIGGGWLAAQTTLANMVAGVALSFAGMTAGMLAGMLAGTWLVERLLVGLRAVGFWPTGWRIGATRTS